MKRLVLVLLILVVIGGTAFSFDISSFPDPIGKNSVMISPTFNLGRYALTDWSYGTTAFSFGMTVAFDYALPIPFALTAGLETGFITQSSSAFKFLAIPILTRVAWHPNFEVRGLDPYVALKLGLSIGTGYKSDYSLSNVNFAWGGNVGCRYFFNDTIGIFGELGYDNIPLVKVSLWYTSYTVYYNPYFHFGVTFRFGGSGGGSSSSGSGRYVVDVDSLNVRNGPSADNALVGSLPRGTRVEVLNSSGTWWEIRSGSIRGYVNSTYLKRD